jgi:hypothetical protein
VTKEELASVTSEYLIGETSAHAYFGAMQEYSILERGKTYTLLIRNDSLQAQVCQEEGSSFLSEGTQIFADALKTADDAGEETGLSIERGTYSYHAKVYGLTDKLSDGEDAVAGIAYFYDGEELVASRELLNSDLQADADGTMNVEIPFTLRVGASSLICKIELESGAEVSVEPISIELLSEKYQYGSDEEQLQTFFDLIQAVGGTAKVYVTQSETYISGGQYSLDYLQSMIPNAQVQALSYEEAYDLSTDAMLLIRGSADGFMELLSKYSLIGHAGQYTLWARNDGRMLQQAVSAGAQIYNSGKKLSPESIAAIQGYDLVEDGLTLEEGQYRITVELDISDIDIDDTVEISLLCDKTEKEIQNEIDELMEAGKTLRQVEKAVDAQKECGSATVEAVDFAGEDTVIITVNTNKNMKLTNLVCEAFSWHGSDVEGEIVWIEKM